jgi:hypothetical protein
MQTILTPTAIPDFFGVGLNGFMGAVPGPPTQVSAEILNSMMQEIINVIIGQGIALDALQFDQLKKAIDDYTFQHPSLAAGGTWTIGDGIALAELVIANASAIQVESGAGFVLQTGSVFVVNSGVTLNAADNTFVWGTSNANDWTINGNVTLGTDGTSAHTVRGTMSVSGILSPTAGVNLGGQTISGTAGSLVDVETLAVTEIRFDSSGNTLPSVAGRVRWNDTLFTFMDGVGNIRALDEPVRGYDAVFQSINTSIGNTTASCTRRVKATEPVWIEMSCRRQMNSTVDMNYRIRVTGPLGTLDIMSDSVGTPTANKGLSWHEVFYWTPTDTWPAETDPQNYTFVVGLGGAGGASTLDAVRVGIKVSSAVQV